MAVLVFFFNLFLSCNLNVPQLQSSSTSVLLPTRAAAQLYEQNELLKPHYPQRWVSALSHIYQVSRTLSHSDEICFQVTSDATFRPDV